MTNETQPKPAQVWRDLDLNAGDIPQAEDRMAVFTGGGLTSNCAWQIHDGRHTGGYGSGQIWQRPVTPGQCDCAKLRQALRGFLEQGQSLGASHPHFANYFTFPEEVWKTAKEFISQPCTCAGKSAEESAPNQFYNVGDLTQYHKLVIQLSRTEAERDEARRKLAEAEKELAMMREKVEAAVLSEQQVRTECNRLRSIKAPAWRSYATDPPTLKDADEQGRVLARWQEGTCYTVPWHWSYIKARWLHLPKLPPEPRQDADPVLKLAKEFAADDGMWNTQECVELNLLEFARRVAVLDFARKQER